jgi:hypothetical protein
VKALSRFAAVFLTLLVGPVFGAIYTVQPGSTLTVGGNFSINFSGISSGSGNLDEQAPGSLTSTLTGSVDAQTSGATLTLNGGTITANPSGNWQPNGSPAAFGFQVIMPLSGPLSGDSVKLIGDVRGLQFNVTGSKPLAGAPGNQTFDTDGLQLNTTSGTIDLQGFFCNPTCNDLGTQSDTFAGPPGDPLNPGAGSLTQSGSVSSLAFPMSLSTSDTMTDTIEGVNVTVTGTLSLTGNVVAASIPEPSTYALLCVGIGATVVVRRKFKTKKV